MIELLAVIVILAIIALIATPIVLNIIEDSKDSARLNSANHSWNVNNTGNLSGPGNIALADNFGGGGVRPVIEVLKSNL